MTALEFFPQTDLRTTQIIIREFFILQCIIIADSLIIRFHIRPLFFVIGTDPFQRSPEIGGTTRTVYGIFIQPQSQYMLISDLQIVIFAIFSISTNFRRLFLDHHAVNRVIQVIGIIIKRDRTLYVYI